MNPKNGNGPENGERTGTYIPAGVLQVTTESWKGRKR